MGIFGSIGKGLLAIAEGARQDDQDGEVERCRRDAGNPLAMPLSDSEGASLALGNREKKDVLASAGVEVSRLSKKGIAADAVELLNGLCGQQIASSDRPSRITVDWENLTKAGKVPKRVAKGHVIFDWKDGGSTICHLWYGRDLKPYAADVYVWEGQRHDYTVRTVGGSMVVQHEALYDARKDFKQILY